MPMTRSASYDYGQPIAGHNVLAFVGESSLMKRQLSSPSSSLNHLEYDLFSSESSVMSSVPNHQVEWDRNISAGSDSVSFTPSDMKPRLSVTPAVVFDVGDYIRRTTEQDPVSFDCTSILLDQSPYNTIASPISPPYTHWAGSPCTLPLSRSGSTTSYCSSFSYPASADMVRMHSSSSHSTGLEEFGDGPGDLSPTNNAGSSPPLFCQGTPLYEGQTDFQLSLNDSNVNRPHRASISSPNDLLSPYSHEMRRSISVQSYESTISDTPQHHNKSPRSRPERPRHQSSRSLAPKATEVIEPAGAPNMVRIRSSDGTERKVGVLPRRRPVELTREPSQKLLCQICNRVPEGFRGEHELQRHTNLFHNKKRKAWICVNRTGDETVSLAGCKQCVEKKKYGAYYNAAAHLRRVHFDPRPRGRKARNSGEKRGGKAGGSWPPMEILKKNWLEEIDIYYDDDDDDTDSEEEQAPKVLIEPGELARPAASEASAESASTQFDFISPDSMVHAYPNATTMPWQPSLSEGLWQATTQQTELLQRMGQTFDEPEIPVGSYTADEEHLTTSSNMGPFL